MSEYVKVVRCKKCKYSKPWYRDKRLCFLWDEDGIDVFEDGYCNYSDPTWKESAINDNLKPTARKQVLEELPTVNPAKHGKWIHYKDEHTCSECGQTVTGDWNEENYYDYCPNCGARMDG